MKILGVVKKEAGNVKLTEDDRGLHLVRHTPFKLLVKEHLK